MSLIKEVQRTRQKVVADGYDMSLGEIINLYKDNELVINPVFQRHFRWDIEKKTRFIESLLLRIPVPPIFVFQDKNGVWELVDGLQRISTILQLTGDLAREQAKKHGPLVLEATRLLPSLSKKRWKASAAKAGDGLDNVLKIDIKRARLRVEILRSGSSESAKFELFQRLNTGGASLSEQEVRNCVAVSLNKEFYDWLIGLSKFPSFTNTARQTDTALKMGKGEELVLRFLSFRSVPYQGRVDVHRYLDDALIEMAPSGSLDMDAERQVFETTFNFLDKALGDSAFQKWNGSEFSGPFLISHFEVIAYGVSQNLDSFKNMSARDRKRVITEKAKALPENKIFKKYTGAGAPGARRIANLLPVAKDLMKP